MKSNFSSSKKNLLFKQLLEESFQRKIKIIGLKKNLIRQSNQIIEDALKGTKTLDKDDLLKLSLPSFIKPQKEKDIKDIILISLYLVQMKKFMKLFGEDLTVIKDNEFYEQLKKIAEKIIYQKYNKDRLILRYGEEGNKFYLLLKGEVHVILPIKKTVYISIKEFKRYMFLLFIYKEFEILKMVIKENRVSQRVGFFNASYYFFPEEIYGVNTNNAITHSSNKNISINAIENKITQKKKNSRNNLLKNMDKSHFLKNNKNDKNLAIEKNFIKNHENYNSNKALKYLNINNSIDDNNFNKIKEIQIQHLRKIMSLYLTEEEIFFYEKTKDDNTKEMNDKIKINTEEYINRLLKYSNFDFHLINIKKVYTSQNDISELNSRYDFDTKNDNEKGNFFIYEYKKITELQIGDMFGDLALSSPNYKRTATIISADQCHFAYLPKELYSEFIEKGNERIRINKINYLCNINIFKNFPKFILERRLFNHFVFKNFQKENYILRTNTLNNNIIFLRDGVFEISFTGKLNDLTDLINYYFYQYIHLINKKDKEETEDDLANSIKIMNYQKSKIERLFQKDLHEEFSYTLFLVNAPSIFGFRTTERKKSQIVVNDKDNTSEIVNVYYSNFCVKCYSNKGEYIYIDKNMFYKHIYGMDSFVQEQTKLYIIEFFRKTIKRLLHIRYIKIWNFFITNEINKNSKINIDWGKLENDEDIYNAVDKLLSLLNEGQLYYNEMSKYINDYFENKKQVIRSLKQKKKLNNQSYEGEKIKNIIFNKNKLLKSSDNSKSNLRASLKNLSMNNVNNIINGKKNNNIEDKYIKIVKNILNMNQDILFKRDSYFPKRRKIRNINRVSSASTPSMFNNRSLFVSKTGKYITTKNYLNYITNKSTVKNNSSMISTALTRKNISINKNEKIFKFMKADIKENTKINEGTSSEKNYFKKINKINYSIQRPLTTKYMNRNRLLEQAKNSEEKYVQSRERYVLKNTRIFFTKNKNFDKIVRLKRNNSTL